MRVYYLDDEIELCDIFLEMLSCTGHQLEAFSVVDEFVDRCLAQRPDLVFIDFRLPTTTGERVASMIQPDIPKVLMTGELSVDCDHLFAQVIAKPFKLKQLVELVNSYSDRSN
jgi:FixJ family two-component response regulator